LGAANGITSTFDAEHDHIFLEDVVTTSMPMISNYFPFFALPESARGKQAAARRGAIARNSSCKPSMSADGS
jgi:hypothetical protein